MNEERRIVPHSASRYRVNPYGEVLDIHHNVIPAVFKDGKWMIELEWVLGKREYEQALVVLLAYGFLEIKPELLDHVEPLYKDGDSRNLAPSNLTYRFLNGPIEVEDVPGFYYIPFFTRYGISRSGDVMNLETRKLLTWSVTKPSAAKGSSGGYHYLRAMVRAGESKIGFRHRLLCFTFKEYPATVDGLVVNHKNGIPGDDRLDNLEWHTYSENAFHAYRTGLRPRSATPVLAKDLKTGKVTRYPTVMECARTIGFDSHRKVTWRITMAPNKVYADHMLFRLDNGAVTWPEIDLEQVKVSRHGTRHNEVIVRNVFTGEVSLFADPKQCSAILGIGTPGITNHCKHEFDIPYGGYNYRWNDGPIEWPVHSARHLEIFRKHPMHPHDGVIAVHAETGEETFFCGRKEAADHFQTSGAEVHKWCRKGRVHRGHRFFLFKVRNKKVSEVPVGSNLHCEAI